jgi:pimeloyl-ACP methyl ester carboxylesterase
MITRPNPTPALELLKKIINHAVNDLKWPLENIHFFGFAQGGTVAAELALLNWREYIQSNKPDLSAAQTSLGSLVTVGGPMLSYPTVSTRSPTPVLVVHRTPPAEDGRLS